jgi:farnesyl-diphosphate farnesyltransferase
MNNNFNKTIKQINNNFSFCEAMLQKVSRTFAINIGFLKGDIYKTVLCGYLFCRIIDTVEDSENLSPKDKIDALNLWADNFPFDNNNEDKLKKFISYLKDEDESYDVLLVRNGKRVFDSFYKIDNNYKKQVIEPVKTMAKGMAEFQSKVDKNGFYQLQNMDELERYCYFVAGTVGEMLTALFILECKDLSTKQKEILENNKISFGLGLQLTNIIKDFKEDLNRDWIYIPKSLMSKQGLTVENFLDKNNKEKAAKVVKELIEKATFHLDKAFEYCVALPKNYSVRMFHFLPLHFAIYSLKKAGEQICKLPRWKVKISRQTVKRLLLLTKCTYFSNRIQKEIYLKARREIL